MYISKEQSTLADLPSLAEKRYVKKSGDQLDAAYRPRSRSLNVYEQYRAESLIERMKHTLEFKLNEPKGFNSYKGNIRNEYIQASFMTLKDLFVKLPESVKFGVEISEPLPYNISKRKSTKANLVSSQNTPCYLSLLIGEWTPTPWN